ncbi:MAG: hypothetical protein ACRDTZ_08490, partial [Pseudonocardiaceae bacterium]
SDRPMLTRPVHDCAIDPIMHIMSLTQSAERSSPTILADVHANAALRYAAVAGSDYLTCAQTGEESSRS